TDSPRKEHKMSEQTGSWADPGPRLAHKAQHDEAFRRQLLADPRAALAKEIGGSSDPEGKGALLEGAAQDLYLALPVARQSGSQQLSGAELQSADCTAFPPPCFDCVGQGCWDA